MDTLAKALFGISIVCNWYLSACIFSLLHKEQLSRMGLDVLHHLRPIVISLNQCVGFAYAKMVMHFLEYGFDKDFWDNCDFVFFVIFSVYVIQ